MFHKNPETGPDDCLVLQVRQKTPDRVEKQNVDALGTLTMLQQRNELL